jgi:zinc transport system substrate-binding protein
LCISGCRQPEGVSDAEGRIKVVATIFPLSDFVRNVGGERVDVFTLLPPAASPHVYSPAPRDLARLQGARLFVKVGLGFEFWAEEMVRSGVGEGVLHVDTSAGVEIIDESEHHDHDSGDRVANPHVWLDPKIAMKQVQRIKEALNEVDPGHQSEYEKNAALYLRQLEDLDQEIRERVNRFVRHSFIAFHPSWAYFARQYGLVQAGVIEASPGREPAPGEIMNIVESIRSNHIQVVFAEPQLNPKAAYVIAAETGVKVLFLDPIGSPDQKDRSTYLKLMGYNLSVMEEAMGVQDGGSP